MVHSQERCDHLVITTGSSAAFHRYYPLQVTPHQLMALEQCDPISSSMGLKISMIQHAFSQQTKTDLSNFDFPFKKKYFIYFDGE